MASGFQEVFDSEGYLSKVRAGFGKSKECCMNAFNGKTYVHISDKSKCFSAGKFDINKSKSVTLSYEEAEQLKFLIESGKCYDTAFHHYGTTTTQTSTSAACYLPLQPQQAMQAVQYIPNQIPVVQAPNPQEHEQQRTPASQAHCSNQQNTMADWMWNDGALVAIPMNTNVNCNEGGDLPIKKRKL